MNDGLYQITISYATFGVIVCDGVATEIAPIARWMIGKTLSFIERWVKRKNGTIERIT